VIGDAVTRFDTGRYVVTRPGPTTFVGGRVTPGVAASFSVDAAVQPATPKDLLRLPEGERSWERLVFFTTDELRTADASKNRLGDRVAYKAKTYEIESVTDWSTVGGFYRSVGKKVEP